MITPRFTRGLLLLSTLILVIVPTGGTSAQEVQELEGEVLFGNAETCTVDAASNPTLHQRCARGTFTAPNVGLRAVRGIVERVGLCDGPVESPIGFTTRETLAEGRGLISPTEVDLGDGAVLDRVGDATGPCTVRISGTFHRVNNKILGRLFIEIDIDTGSTLRDFHHSYCARFNGTAVPGLDGRAMVKATVEGRLCADPRNPDETPVPTHGRRPADDADRHGGECPPGHLPPTLPECD